MERKIEHTLVEWKNKTNRMPLIVHGARQVGKTYSVLRFGKSNYKNVAYCNFESNAELQQIFAPNFDTQRIIRELSVFTAKQIHEHDTLIFFDEIQAAEQALSSLKYFAEQAPQYHIIAAGSLLGVAINRQRYSFPVGKVEMQTLMPMDFEEFLWAVDQHLAVDIIKESFEKNIECTLHQQFINYYKTFLCTGGMPHVVSEYIDKQDFDYVSGMQKNITNAYVADMAKYATPVETVRIMAVFNSIPAQLARDNKKFQYKIIKSGARAKQYELALQWLQSSGIIIYSPKINEGKLPLSIYTDSNSFKTYLNDTGLLLSQIGVPAKIIQSEIGNYQNFKGMLAENYVAVALAANNYTPYYWASEGKAEVDFVIQHKTGNIIPIEVKSADNVRSKSLQQYVNQYKPLYSIRISTKNFGFENNIKSVPLYACFCI
jgi:uncharacterized protein